ncbi:MAG: hypothetical protein K6343_05070 [Caldisericaceae bacterium]
MVKKLIIKNYRSIKNVEIDLELFNAFINIQTYALIDQDPGNASTQKIITELENVLGVGNVFLQEPNLEGMFNFPEKFTKEKALKFFPDWFKENEPPEVYKNIKQKLFS